MTEYQKQSLILRALVGEEEIDRIFSLSLADLFTDDVIEDLYENTTNTPNTRMVSRDFNFRGIIIREDLKFIWDGSSTPIGFRWIIPQWRHPKASVLHDFLCKLARTKKERKFADKIFRYVVGRTSSKVTKTLGYLGVRIGALFTTNRRR
jgi:hypothetical protein